MPVQRRGPASAVLGTPTNTTVTVLDPDKGVSFRFASYPTNVTEDVGEAVIGIARGDLGDQPMSVDLNTSDISAHEGVDYIGLHTNVVLPADKRPYFFTIPILNNQIKDGNRTFRVTMSNPVGGAVGCTPSTIVTIVDNDPGFEFEAAGYSVGEDGGSVLIGVRRGHDDTTMPVTVDYATSDLSALAGTDYLSTNGTLAFAAGEQVKQIAVPILNDGLKESTKTFRVTHPRPTSNFYVPSSYAPATSMPLVFLLHGTGDTGQVVEDYMKFRPLAETRGFLYCYPEGSDFCGYHTWNATDVQHDPSADWGAAIPDDAGYLGDLIEEIAQRFNVDRKRIYMVGRAGGANMVWRMGAQFADLLAGISTQANSGFWDPTLVVPSEPIHVLYLHSLDDDYWGGPATVCDGLCVNTIAWPSAARTTQDWANYNGASNPVTDPEPTMDLIYDVAGLDTVVTRYQDHPPGGAVELWTLTGGPHKPNITPNYSQAIVDWLLAHPKP